MLSYTNVFLLIWGAVVLQCLAVVTSSLGRSGIPTHSPAVRQKASNKSGFSVQTPDYLLLALKSPYWQTTQSMRFRDK